jgi:hypothetical protein
MTHLETAINNSKTQAVSKGLNTTRSARPVLRSAAPLMFAAAAAPDDSGPESLDDLLKNSGAGSTTIASVPQVPAPPVVGSPPTTSTDTQYLAQLESLINLNTFISVYRGATMMQKRKTEGKKGYDLSIEAGQFILDLANTTNDLMSMYLTKYLTIDTASQRTFSKSATTAELHLEFLTELFAPFGFDSAATKQLDNVLTSVVDAIKGLSINFTSQQQSLDHFLSMMYFEPVEGLSIKVPKLRFFYLHVDQHSWSASMGGKGSINQVNFNMNYVVNSATFNYSMFDQDWPTLLKYMNSQSSKDLDELNKLVPKVDGIKDTTA